MLWPTYSLQNIGERWVKSSHQLELTLFCWILLRECENSEHLNCGYSSWVLCDPGYCGYSMSSICEGHMAMGRGALNASFLLERSIVGVCGCPRAGPVQPNTTPRGSIAVPALTPPLYFGREREGLPSLQLSKGWLSILTLGILVFGLHKFHSQEKIVVWGVRKSLGHLIAIVMNSKLRTLHLWSAWQNLDRSAEQFFVW